MTQRPTGNAAADGESALRRAGLRLTLARVRVLEIVRNGSSRHLSAEDVFVRLFEQGADSCLATVYRALSELEGAGLVLRNVFEGGKAVFESAEGERHDHLVCLQCKCVDEFRSEPIEALEREVAAARGYARVGHRLELYGYCSDCVSARRKVLGVPGPGDAW